MASDFQGGGAVDTSSVQHDGSVDQAALLMPDIIDEDERPARQEQPQRETAAQRQQKREQGRYAEGFEDVPAKEASAEEEPEERNDLDDEEWIEFPAEQDGEQPTRLKAADVVRGYQEAQQLREALEQVKRITPPPPQYDEEIVKTAQARFRLTQELNQLIQMNQGFEPDRELLNPGSGSYDPAEYHRQDTYARQMAAQRNALQARLSQENDLLQQEQKALYDARRAREQGKLLQFWPELKDPGTRTQVRDEAARYYGVDEEVFSNLIDSRFYAVLRDALAYRSGMKQRQQAVKVVRAKPKLVRGAARDPSGPKNAQLSASMKRLSQSGSIEDGADALGALL